MFALSFSNRIRVIEHCKSVKDSVAASQQRGVAFDGVGDDYTQDFDVIVRF